MSATRRTYWGGLPAFGLMIALFCGFSSMPARPTDAGPFADDAHTGLGIDGFDPVAYFAGQGAVLGHPQIEYRYADTTWRFRNEGNRAAFAEHPEIYAPQFGGYDPVAIARGVSVAGHPMIWAINGDRLYLFYDEKSQREFVAEPERVIEVAERKWPDVRRTLP